MSPTCQCNYTILICWHKLMLMKRVFKHLQHLLRYELFSPTFGQVWTDGKRRVWAHRPQMGSNTVLNCLKSYYQDYKVLCPYVHRLTHQQEFSEFIRTGVGKGIKTPANSLSLQCKELFCFTQAASAQNPLRYYESLKASSKEGHTPIQMFPVPNGLFFCYMLMPTWVQAQAYLATDCTH